MSLVLDRPRRAPRSRPVNPGAKATRLGKGTTALGKRTGAARATGLDKGRRTTLGNEARQRGTPQATIKAHRQVPQTRRARTTRNKPRHENRCPATPAAVWLDVCAPTSIAAPAGDRKAAVRMDECTLGSVPSPCRLQNSRRADGRVRARRVPSPCRLQEARFQMDGCAQQPQTTQHT